MSYRRQRPIILLTAAIVVTLAAMVLSVLEYYSADRASHARLSRALRIEELRGIIVHLDEVLTMSARMAAATGDGKWEERYNNLEVRLDRAIKEARGLAPGVQSAEGAAKTDVANQELVGLERRAFGLVRQGRLDEARAVLDSAEYEGQKRIYSNGMGQFIAALAESSAQEESLLHREQLWFAGGLSAAVACLLLGWVAVVRALRRWMVIAEGAKRRSEEQAEDLANLNLGLDRRVKERTRELESARAEAVRMMEEADKARTEAVASEQARRQSEERLRITLASIGDGVIATDTSRRVTQLNKVAEALTGWTFEEAVGKPLGEVFQIINEETRAPADDPVARVLATGRVEGLANHTVLIARDGMERAIADSAAPILDAAGEVTGVVLVFRDQTGERAAQKALQESEAKYRNLAENLNELIYRADPETFAGTYVNSAIEGIYGYAVGEWFKDPGLWERAIHPEDKERVLAWFTEGHRTMESGVVQYRIIRKDKTVRWVEDHTSWEKDEHGNAVSLNGVLYDITERKRAQDALARSEAILRAVFDGTRDGILGADSQTRRFVVANEAICRMLGYSHDEIMALGVQDIHPAEDLAHVVEQFDRQMRGEISLAVDMPMRRKDGSVFYADINATSVDLAGRPCVIGVFRDITERRKAEAALALSSQQWQDTFDALDDLVFILGADWRIVQVNRAMRETFPGIDLVGRKCHEIIHGTDTPFPGCQTCMVLQSGQSVRFEMQNAHLGNRWFDVQAYPIRDAARSVQQLVHVFRDITERKKAEAEIITARREAEAANEAKSTFLANMSHEIRTPLTAILGYAELMTDREQSAPERDEAVLTIRRNSKHLLGLINDILDLSKIEAGKVELSLSGCSIPAVIADVVSMLRARCSQAGLSLGVEYGGEFPETILADEARVRQVLVNLAGNAIKFTEKGGVRIVASFVREWRDGRPGVRIDVIDTGIGIAAEDVARMAEPFVQVNPSVSRKHGGTGLGLAISRRLVKTMGGDFEIKSQPGQGSTFSFVLPTGPLEGVAMLKNPTEVLADHLHSGRAAAARVSLAGVHLLLAEDGADNQRLIRTILEKAGASVVVAGNGREALDRALGEPFGVILMDMQMPEMDGYTATRLLRERGFSGPVVALTAHALAGDRGRCIAAGCTDYLVKPVDRARLITTVALHAGLEVQADRAELEPSIFVAAAAGGGEVIRSEFADDPDLGSVIDEFIDGLAAHVTSMEDALKRGQMDAVQREAHQLKGAGGSYGYPSLTNAARIVEEAAKAGDGETVAAAVGAVKKLCGAIARGRRQDVVSKELGHEGADH